MKPYIDISIDHPALQKAKTDFDAILKSLMTVCAEKGYSGGAVTLKLSIEIEKTADEGGQIALVPHFEHKASSKISVKGAEIRGESEEETELFLDTDRQWKLFRKSISLFDPD